MKKQILTLMIASAIASGAMPILEVSAETPNVTVYITTENSSVSAGDEIEFTVSFGQLNGFTGYQMYFDIPEGLTYVQNSVEINSDFKNTLQFDDVLWDEDVILLSGNGAEPYSTEGVIDLCTFKCTVDDDAVPGDYMVTFDENKVFEVLDANYDATSYQIIPATVNVIMSDDSSKLDDLSKPDDSSKLDDLSKPDDSSKLNDSSKSDESSKSDNSSKLYDSSETVNSSRSVNSSKNTSTTVNKGGDSPTTNPNTGTTIPAVTAGIVLLGTAMIVIKKKK